MAGSKQKVRRFKKSEAEALYAHVAAALSTLKLIGHVAAWRTQADKLRESTIELAQALEAFEGFVSWATIRNRKTCRMHQVPLFPNVHPDILVPAAPLIILTTHTPDVRLKCSAALRTAPEVLHPFVSYEAQELGEHQFIVTPKREHGERSLREGLSQSA